MSGPQFPWEEPLGVRPHGEGSVSVRVWAPRAERVAIRIGGTSHALDDVGYGMRAGVVPGRVLDTRPGAGTADGLAAGGGAAMLPLVIQPAMAPWRPSTGGGRGAE